MIKEIVSLLPAHKFSLLDKPRQYYHILKKINVLTSTLNIKSGDGFDLYNQLPRQLRKILCNFEGHLLNLLCLDNMIV